MRKSIVLTALLMIVAAATPLSADVPQLINYQSVVTDNLGDPIADGVYGARFYIYDAEIGGTQLWVEVNPAVAVNSSRFNVLLGSIEPLHDSVFSGLECWLEVVFDGETLVPRTRLVTVGYAHRIATVDGASGGAIAGDVSITATSIGNALEVTQHTPGARAARFEVTSLAGTEPAVLGISNGTGPAVWGTNPWGGPGMRSTGGFTVTDDNLNTKFEVNPYGNLGGGDVYVYQSNGDKTVEILGTEASNEFGQLNFFKSGVNTIAISGGNSSQAGDILLSNDSGDPTVFIDGENSSNGGRIVVYDGADANIGGVTVGYVQLGTNSGANLLLDNNEIIARDAGQASQLYLQADGGSVGIGTNGLSVPAGYILGVDGKAIMEEIEVQLSADWPDYVFDDDYALPALDELRSHIAEHKHLPGIPSAAQMDGKTLPLGEMQVKLLEKVEELTLYMLQIKGELDDAHSVNADLRSRIEELEANRN